MNTAGSALPKDEILQGKQHHLFSAFPQQDGGFATLSFDPGLSDKAQSINSPVTDEQNVPNCILST